LEAYEITFLHVCLFVNSFLSQSVSQSVCLGIEHPCGTCDQISLPVGMLLSEIYGHVDVEVTLRLTASLNLTLNGVQQAVEAYRIVRCYGSNIV
jgi:hypothetical protein